MNPHRAEYVARLNRVVEFIDAHLTETLSLETLAAVANFSPFHFHRLFAAMTGETLADCIRRRRLESAANLLMSHPRKSVLTVAIDSGFASSEVFSRNFRKHFGCSASEWRRGGWRQHSSERMAELRKIHQPLRKNDHALPAAALDHASMNPNAPTPAALAVTIRTLPARRVAYLRHVGPYTPALGATWKRLWAWCGSHGVRPNKGLAFGIVLDNPHVTEPSKCRYDACVAIDEKFEARGNIGLQSTPAGRYACYAFVGTPDDMTDAWNRLYGEWLPDSGYEFGEGRLLEMYQVDDAHDDQGGLFRCELCLPVVPA